jgi:alkanesulfonate monooxygenase SsuD/methylene tetrahydromethanopterin reductase-like flavin-dependent oxidoreductase (luciferase family)
MTWSDSRQTTSGSSRIVAVVETAKPPATPRPSAGGSSLGVTAAPFIRSGTAAAVDLAARAERLGYDSFWVAEVTGVEAFSVLGAVSRAAPGVGLGTGVLAMQVRTPPLLAMAAASVKALAPDRKVLLGVGVSSPVVACDWHGAGYPARALACMREFIALLRECLSGDTVTFAGDYYQVRRFRLGVEPGRPQAEDCPRRPRRANAPPRGCRDRRSPAQLPAGHVP